MVVKNSDQTDTRLSKVEKALEAYREDHSRAETKAYRQNSASIRVRVVDSGFKRFNKATRHEKVWKFLEDRLSQDVLSDITMLLLLTPEEMKDSFANIEFDNPTSSEL
jgi:stress-induced morphogen